MLILDANMILRYLLNDNLEMADQAEKYIEQHEAHVTVEVIAEVVYVLGRVYKVKRQEITQILSAFLDSVTSRDIAIIQEAVATYGDQKLDFVDCVMYAYAKINHAHIATYDKKLNKLLDTLQ